MNSVRDVRGEIVGDIRKVKILNAGVFSLNRGAMKFLKGHFRYRIHFPFSQRMGGDFRGCKAVSKRGDSTSSRT